MKTKFLIICIAVLCFSAAPAIAAWSVPGAALQQVLDDITVDPLGDSSIDVTTDYVPDVKVGLIYGDSYWDITATGGSVSTVIIELASFKANNLFGVYDSAGSTVQIFDGAAAAGSQATLSITDTGDVFLNHVDTGVDFVGDSFGYYLDSTYYSNGGFFYSDTGKNSDGYDHMFAYQGNDSDVVQIDPWDPGVWTDNEYILAFEDLDGSVSDWDYTDFVVMVESVMPVPVPAAVILGVIGLCAVGLKLRKYT